MEKINKEDLLLLKKEDLASKYKEVIGEDALATLTKEQLADAIVAKSETSESEQKKPNQETQTPPASGIIADPKQIQASIEKKEETQTPPVLADIPYDHIHLQKFDKEKLIDEIVLPKAVYKNLPESHRKEWKVKTPVDIQNSQNGDNK